MREPKDLTKGELVDLVTDIRECLYLNLRTGELDGGNEWDPENIERVTAALAERDLVPAAEGEPE